MKCTHAALVDGGGKVIPSSKDHTLAVCAYCGEPFGRKLTLRAKWTLRTVYIDRGIQTAQVGRVPRDGEISDAYPGLQLHRWGNGRTSEWNISHVETGKRIARARTRAYARHAIAQLSSLADWTANEDTIRAAYQSTSAIRQLVAALNSQFEQEL